MSDPNLPPDHSRDELHALYLWVDEIPLSRVKKNIVRDFSDGVLMAELVHRFYPKLVEIHNYIAAHSVSKKMYNWTTLKKKVFSRLRFQLPDSFIDGIVNCRPLYIQDVLFRFKAYAESGAYERLQKKQRTRHAATRRAQEDEIRSIAQTQMRSEMDLLRELVEEKDRKVAEMRETIQIMQRKIDRLESLVTLKDRKIGALTSKIREMSVTEGTRRM